jgi:opacity protein-like surface antigen
MRALALLLILLAAPAHAEWYADIYGGAAYTPHSDMTLVVGSASGPADHVFHDVKWNQSTELGMRAGYWFDSLPWYGIGLDAFHFDANAPGQTVDLTISGATAPATLQAIDVSASVVAFDVVRLRYPLMASGEYPRGRLQPYASAGPALFRVRVTNKANGELTTQPASDTSLGYKMAAGLSWQFTPRIGLFGEYRYTHAHAEADLQGTITGARVPTRFDLDTHHLVAGLSLRF